MRRLLQRGLSAATVTCGLFFAGQALAGGSGMPWRMRQAGDFPDPVPISPGRVA